MAAPGTQSLPKAMQWEAQYSVYGSIPLLLFAMDENPLLPGGRGRSSAVRALTCCSLSMGRYTYYLLVLLQQFQETDLVEMLLVAQHPHFLGRLSAESDSSILMTNKKAGVCILE
jgi:hypothetical protein